MTEADQNSKDALPERTVQPEAVATAASAKEEPKPAKKQPSRDWFARLLTLLLIGLLGAVAAAGWQLGRPMLLEREARLVEVERQLGSLVDAAETSVASAVQPLESRITEAERQVTAALSDNQQQVAESLGNTQRQVSAAVSAAERQIASAVAEQRTEMATAKRTLDDELRRLDQRFLRMDERLSRLTATDRRAWLVQEAAFTVRLAGQRLLIARDVASAAALLLTADDLLKEADDPLFDTTRRFLAADRAQLLAITPVDVLGLHARLDGLIDVSGELAIVPVETAEPVATDADWSERAEAGWKAALNKLSDHLVIRQRAVDLTQLMTPESESLVRQNLRMLLEQAQIALLSGNQELYGLTIDRARTFAQMFAESDPLRVGTIDEELAALIAEPISVDLPDLVDSRRAMSEAIRLLDAEPGS